MNQEAVASAIKTFRSKYPDFESFDNPGAQLAREELNYKTELARRFSDLSKALLASDIDSNTIFLDDFYLLLKKKLPDEGQIQNLVNWMDRRNLFQKVTKSRASKASCTRLIANLLQAADSEDECPTAINQFVSWLTENGGTPAGTKIWPTLILFLWRPTRFIFLKPRFFDRALKHFGFNAIGQGLRLTSDIYLRVMQDMSELKEALAELGPRDYIDVQSFMWSVVQMNVEDEDAFPTIKFWIVRLNSEEVQDAAKQDISVDITDWTAHKKFYTEFVDQRLETDDYVLALGPGWSSRVLAEARVDEAEIAEAELKLKVKEFVTTDVDVKAGTNYQAVVPGLFTGAKSPHGAARICREYLDQTRPAYLLTWNPDKFSKGGAGTEEGRLGYVIGDMTTWACHTTKINPGDPVYLMRLGSKWPRGLIAKGRACSEVGSALHWDKAKKDQEIRCIKIAFEDVRDGSDVSFIDIERLTERFPQQHWSTQSSGIEIREEYRRELHKLWEAPNEEESLAELFRKFKSSDRAREWVPAYRTMLERIDKARKSANISDSLLEDIWLRSDNGITNAGQGKISKRTFTEHQIALSNMASRIINEPKKNTFDAVVDEWERLKDEGSVTGVPRVVIRRAFSAADPKTLTSHVQIKYLDELGRLLENRYEKLFEDGDNWFDKNRKLKNFLKAQGVDDHDPAMVNTFAWHLYEYLKGPPLKVNDMAQNVILYGPPGTGKTYALRKEYFPRYTSQSQAMSDKEWLDSVVGDLKWYEVIAAALHDLGGGPVKTKALVEHEFTQANARLRGLPEVSPQTIWGTLLRHTSFENEFVNVASRVEPFWFWKEEGSVWRFADDWEETGNHVIEAIERIASGPGESSEPIKRYEFVTFHQSYSYEEFVEGIRPSLGEVGDSQSQISYELNNGVFKRLCDRARQDPDRKYALFIDEINRGNISKILGELITLLETDKREGANNEISATLPYSGARFSVPQNVDVIGTMNTADRSLAHIDTALRRRFTFKELTPKSSVLSPIEMNGVQIDIPRLLDAMNERIEAIFDREHMIGHAYFIDSDGETVSGALLPAVFENKVIPLLTEYFFEDWAKVRAVLADDNYGDNPEKQFVREVHVSGNVLSGNSVSFRNKIYRLNPSALKNPMAYVKIYDNSETEADD